MKELEAIRELARKWREDADYPISKLASEEARRELMAVKTETRSCIRELEALLPALDRAIAEHERLAVAAARRDAIEKCRIALHANFLGPQAEELCGMFTRWMRDDAQTLDAHDAALWNEALEEGALAVWMIHQSAAAKLRALKREKRGGE